MNLALVTQRGKIATLASLLPIYMPPTYCKVFIYNGFNYRLFSQRKIQNVSFVAIFSAIRYKRNWYINIVQICGASIMPLLIIM